MANDKWIRSWIGLKFDTPSGDIEPGTYGIFERCTYLHGDDEGKKPEELVEVLVLGIVPFHDFENKTRVETTKLEYEALALKDATKPLWR